MGTAIKHPVQNEIVADNSIITDSLTGNDVLATDAVLANYLQWFVFQRLLCKSTRSFAFTQCHNPLTAVPWSHTKLKQQFVSQLTANGCWLLTRVWCIPSCNAAAVTGTWPSSRCTDSPQQHAQYLTACSPMLPSCLSQHKLQALALTNWLFISLHHFTYS